MVIARTPPMEKERIRKRPRLAWDVPPPEEEALERPAVAAHKLVVERHITPPRRDDDREGHYAFSLGENLTPR
ncbi:hypothetical protein CRG98_008725, partial [Punica granatum]